MPGAGPGQVDLSTVDLSTTRTAGPGSDSGHLSEANVKARMIWRCATADTSSTGAITNMLPAMMMCQRAPVPSSRSIATPTGRVRTCSVVVITSGQKKSFQ